MLKYKVFFNAIIAAVLFSFLGHSQAATMTSASNITQPKVENSGVKIYKVVYLINKIKNNILYLDNKQRYNLSNVKVTRISGGNSNRKKTAEMLFINGVLKEVVIR